MRNELKVVKVIMLDSAIENNKLFALYEYWDLENVHKLIILTFNKYWCMLVRA